MQQFVYNILTVYKYEDSYCSVRLLDKEEVWKQSNSAISSTLKTENNFLNESPYCGTFLRLRKTESY
jgi:hypothetical protein